MKRPLTGLVVTYASGIWIGSLICWPAATLFCLLAGLLTGLITAVLVLFYNIIYRGASGLDTYEIIMPLSIFTAFPLFGLVSGGTYYLFASHLRRGDVLYCIVCILFMSILVLVTALTGHSVPPGLKGFRGLFVGIELITGILAAIAVPFFAHHEKLFMTPEDLRGEE